jgi:CheY-like chemotaxis protein
MRFLVTMHQFANNGSAPDPAVRRSDGGCRTVLVVDDECLLRMSLADQLRDCGFAVLEAGTAGEAVSVMGAHRVDLVFSDVRMPGAMNGVGLAQWVRQNRPGVRMLLTSAYTHVADAADPFCDARLIAKPYDESEVIDRIGRLLSA